LGGQLWWACALSGSLVSFFQINIVLQPATVGAARQDSMLGDYPDRMQWVLICVMFEIFPSHWWLIFSHKQ